MGLKLSNARVEVRDLHPILRVEIEGRETILGVDAKEAIHNAGLVFIGEEFSDLAPDRVITVDGNDTELVGFTDDPGVFRLYDAFLDACAKGEVPYGSFPIPD
jgi:hypothetical protein